jgi:proteasome lid subunit RPN8/RPN11
MNLTVTMPRSIFDDIIDQARQEQPRECCGLLGGYDSQARSRYPLQNRSPEPEARYFAAPEDLFEAMRQMRAVNEQLISIYHSHPHGPAYPSPTDVELAFYPQAIYLIIALEPQTEMRAFRINGHEVSEMTIVVIKNEER